MVATRLVASTVTSVPSPVALALVAAQPPSPIVLVFLATAVAVACCAIVGGSCSGYCLLCCRWQQLWQPSLEQGSGREQAKEVQAEGQHWRRSGEERGRATGDEEGRPSGRHGLRCGDQHVVKYDYGYGNVPLLYRTRLEGKSSFG